MQRSFFNLMGIALSATIVFGLLPAGADLMPNPPKHSSPAPGVSDYYDIEGNVLIYLNWDAFAGYYYDLAQQGDTTGTPVINRLISEGAFFTDMHSGLPSITNPMQTSILCGAWPATTKNPYRYYDAPQNKVIGFARENEAENMAQAMLRQGFNVASVNQFILESREETNVYHGKQYYDKGCKAGDKNAAYFTSGNNGIDRIDGMIALIKGEAVGTGSNRMTLDRLPNFIAGYMDDIDALGHNENSSGYDGVPMALTEQGRLKNVLDRLEILDAKLGELVAACKATGIYDRMTFVLGTDHGMHPFGSQSGAADEYSVSKLNDIYAIIDRYGIIHEYVGAGKSPAATTQLVIVSSGLQLQLTIRDSTIPKAAIEAMMAEIAEAPYVVEVLNASEIDSMGAIEGFADYIVSPKAPYHFKPGTTPYNARGQHESLDPHANKVFALMWGNNIRPGVTYTQRAEIIDLIPTAAQAAGVEGPANATGQVLSDVLIAGWDVYTCGDNGGT